MSVSIHECLNTCVSQYMCVNTYVSIHARDLWQSALFEQCQVASLDKSVSNSFRYDKLMGKTNNQSINY